MAALAPHDRLPPIPAEQWSPAQRACAQEIIAGPRGALIEPFVPLLRSPELCTHAQRMGEYLRYRSRLGLRLSELAILVTARHWSQPVEWAIHAPIARRTGIAEEVIAAIGRGERPAALNDDEALVYDFCIQLHRTQGVGQACWQAAVARLGEAGAIDLVGINGYYAMLAMVMNVAGTPAPSLGADELPPLRKKPQSLAGGS